MAHNAGQADPQPEEVYEKGSSRRVILEACEWSPDPSQEVIYALYRKELLWRQADNSTRSEWRYLRQGYCKLKTFRRWANGATRLK